MANKEKNNEFEEIDVLDILLDEENDSPITMYNEKDEKVLFEQVAVIPMDGKIYAILKPQDEMEGVANDEALVFYVEEREYGSELIVETDEEKAIKVFDEYYKLLDELEEAEK